MSPDIIASTDAQATLERFADPTLVANGQIVLVSVAAIRERMGSRWLLRREGVWDFLERQFRKERPPTDHVSRLDDDAFLLVLPSLDGRMAAETAAINLLRQVLEFFLGRSGEGDVRISRVASVSSNGIEHSPLTAEEIATLWRAAATFQEMAPSKAKSSPNWRELHAPDQRILYLTSPIWNIRRKAVVAHRFQPITFDLDGGNDLLPAEIGQLRIRDLVERDITVLDAALNLLRTSATQRRFALYVPLRIETLGSSHRWRILSLLRADVPLARFAIVPCIEGVHSGTPPGQLTEIATVLKPSCRGVVAHSAGLDIDVQRWMGAPIGAIAIDFADLDTSGAPRLPDELARFRKRTRAVCSSVVAYSVTSTAATLAAWSAGFTHISGDVVGDRLTGGLLPVRFAPADLYPRRPTELV